MSEYCLILSTCENTEKAKQIIQYLLKKKWIACANFFHVESMFHWKEKVQNTPEVQMILKTTTQSFEKVKTAILEQGSYEVPEIIQIEIEKGYLPYLSWIDETVK